MLTTLVQEINERRPRLRKFYNYYAGRHKITFVGSELQQEFGQRLSTLSCNRCEVVIDSVLDKLAIVGFEDKAEESDHEQLAQAWWDSAKMSNLSRRLHQEALIHGDSFALAWINADGQLDISVQQTDQFAVAYDDENPDILYAAAKAWKLRDGRWRMNIYYADRLEKFVTKKPSDMIPDAEQAWSDYSDKGDYSWPIPHNFGRVPVFHFSVNARAGEYGRSDIEAVIPMQDALNRTLANQAVAEEYQSYKQRWATGIQAIEVPIHDDNGNIIGVEKVSPFDEGGADRLWLTESKDAKFGEFSAADLTMFETVINGHELRIARTARIPLHYFTGMGGDAPSGESLKTIEQPFIDKVRDRQRAFGSTWNDLVNFVLFVRYGIEASVEVVWKSPEARLSEKERVEVALLKQNAGVSQSQTLRELEYSQQMIEAFEEERDDDQDGRYPA